MTSDIDRPFGNPADPRDYPLDWVEQHIEEERRSASLLGEIREIVFGAQDGLVSTLAVVATVAGASSSRTAILVAGLASAMAGVFSMSIGEYMSSKSQGEIQEWQLKDEWEEVQERPAEAEAEMAFMFMQEGMDTGDAWNAANLISRNPRSLLATMVSKELGLVVDDVAGSPFRGALFMGGAFALGSAIPIVPFFFGSGIGTLAIATGATALALFTIGAVKSRWTRRSWLASGAEIVALAATAGVAGYLFGSVLPSLLGFNVPA